MTLPSNFESYLGQFDVSTYFVIHIGEFIRYLVGKKQLVEAIRFIITFRINNITPIPLLFLLKEDVKEKMKCCRRDCKNEKSEDEKVPNAVYSII